MGKGAGKQANLLAGQQADVGRQTAAAGQELLGEAKPIRQQVQGTLSAIASGKPGELQRAVAPQINSATSQFFSARRNALNMPPGGARDQALRDLRMGEAMTKSGIYSSGVGTALQQLQGMSLNLTSSGVQAYNAAGANLGSAAQTYQQQASDSAGNWGSLAGAGGAIAAAAIMV